MAARFLISLDIDSLQLPTEDLLAHESPDLKVISLFGHVQINVNPTNLSTVVSFLRHYFNDFAIYCDVVSLTDLSGVVSLLDNGATKVFVSRHQLKEIVEQGSIEDLGRLVLSLDCSSSIGNQDAGTEDVEDDIRALIGDNVVDIKVQNDSVWRSWVSIPNSNPHKGYSNQNRSLVTDTWDEYVQAINNGHVPIVPANALTTEPDRHPHLITVHRLITGVMQSDRADGLFSTVVVDEYDVCLGLVYSNHESIATALRLRSGVYHSRSRNRLWIKGAESGDTQELLKVVWDCDMDALRFTVRQKGDGFCHLKSSTCFGTHSGLPRLEKTLKARKSSPPTGSYTARLFKEPKLLEAKIMEEASELCEASTKEEVAAETADLFYFALTKCILSGVNFGDIEKNLDFKSLKTTRRKGDAKMKWAAEVGLGNEKNSSDIKTNGVPEREPLKEAASIPKSGDDPAGIIQGKIHMRRYKTTETDPKTLENALQRPSQRSTDEIMGIVNPIIKEVCQRGDSALLQYTHKFDKAISLSSPVLKAPFPSNLMKLSTETKEAIDISFENIRCFHEAQREEKPLQIETMPGVVCSRFSRPIERVGLYVPGGTAVLPSTAMMLGVPAMVAGCKKIVLASPPRSDGTVTAEIVYVAHKIGAESIVLAGGAQAVAALAYGTESVTKVDKILGPGNQFVTAAKMIVSNDTTAGVSIDMPAGPSEVLVIADKTADPRFVASDLLSQAEHGTDSQVILIAAGLDEAQLSAIESELHKQANALPRLDIVRGAIEHSITLLVENIAEAMDLSNRYAPEHLILQVDKADTVIPLVQNAGSVFIGHWTPESVGDYSAGVNHSLPTYGYAKQYSGVNLGSFTKHITSSHLTQQGLRNVGGAVMQMANVEELEAHRRAVSIRLKSMNE